MKVLVLGGSGMAGHTVAKYLQKAGNDVLTIGLRSKLDSQTVLLDIHNADKVTNLLRNQTFDCVINCIGVLVRQCESNNANAIYVNSFFPKLLEQTLFSTKTKLIHISTDAVFSGEKIKYFEDSKSDAKTFYGKTKFLGEIDNKKDLTIRTSIIGPELSIKKNSLFNWLVSQKGVVDGYDNVLWKGITTITLAQAIERFMHNDISGIIHLVPKKRITKFELLLKIKEVFDLNQITIRPMAGVGNNANIVNTKNIDIDLPGYLNMLTEMRVWIESRADIYDHYKQLYPLRNIFD